jgi:hypothetical protein
MKNCQHQHKGKPHTQKKSEDAATSMEDAITYSCTAVQLRPHVYVPEEPGEYHAQEAEGYHQERGEPHQVLAKGDVHTMSPFHG